MIQPRRRFTRKIETCGVRDPFCTLRAGILAYLNSRFVATTIRSFQRNLLIGLNQFDISGAKLGGELRYAVSGGAALKFDPTDVADMSAAIARVLNEERLREQLVSLGIARANELSWAQTAKLTLSAYRKAQRRQATGDNGA